MAYGGAGSNIKLLSLTDANAWRDVLGWDINANGEIDGMTAYSAVGWVNRCVHLRAATLASLPWSLRKGDSEIANSEDEDYTALPWLEMLPDLLYLAESALCIVGCAYLGKVRTRGKRLESLRWFAPPTMTPLWSPTDGLVGYERKLGSAVKGQPWRVEDVIYFRTPNPMHETEPGPSPVATALIDAQVIYNLNQYSSLFFQRGAIKPTLLTVEGNPIAAERERLKAWWQRAFSGVKNAFNTEVVSANVKPIVVGEGIAELNNADLTAEKREAISTALGVPHSLVMSNAANFAVSESDRLNLYDTTVIPESKFVANQLNRQLFNEFGYRLVFKPETLALYQEDEEQRATALTQFVNAGMKLSIAAEILGIQLPDGMEYADLDEQPEPQTITVVAQPRQIEDSQAPVADQEKQVEAAKFRKWLKRRPDADIHEFKTAILSHDDLHEIAEEVRGVATEQPFFTLPETFTRESVAAIKALILQLDPSDDEAEQKIRMELEKRSARAIDKAFTEMVNTLFPEGYGSTGAFIDPNLEAGRIHRAFVEDQKLRDAVARALIDGSDLGVSVAIDQMENVGLAFDWTLAHTAARDWATRYTDDLLNQMGTTSGRLVGQAVGRWFNNGEPLEKLIGDLEPAFGRRRAERIAATEVTRAAFEGSRAGYRESGVIQKMVWRTSRDERVCPICGPMEGRYADLSGVWPGGVRIPAHPNCRCWASPVVETP